MDAEPENETFSQKMWEVAFEGGREKNIKRNQKKNRIINRKMEKFDAYSQHSFPVQISSFCHVPITLHCRFCQFEKSQFAKSKVVAFFYMIN